MIKESNELSLMERQRLPLDLKMLNVSKLSFIDSLEDNAYTFYEDQFHLVLTEDEIIDWGFIKEYVDNYGKDIFVSSRDFKAVREALSEELTKMTRSLSIGDILKNSFKQSSLLTLHLENLYQDPFDDKLLNNQYQGAKNLTSVLANNNYDQELYHRIQKQDYHFVLKHPLASSVMLMAFLKELKAFSTRENEFLFLTNYFKDIGMSFVSRKTWSEPHLSDFEKDSLCQHSDNSVIILEGRIPLSKKYFNIIQNHNNLNNKLHRPNEENYAVGIETVMVNAIDIFVAMTTKRPYRQSYTIFKALDFLKILISEEYPHEYTALVKFIMRFLKR